MHSLYARRSTGAIVKTCPPPSAYRCRMALVLRVLAYVLGALVLLAFAVAGSLTIVDLIIRLGP